MGSGVARPVAIGLATGVVLIILIYLAMTPAYVKTSLLPPSSPPTNSSSVASFNPDITFAIDPSMGNHISPTEDARPKLAMVDDSVYQSWQSKEESLENPDIFFRAVDYGKNLGHVINISNTSEFSANHQMAAVGSDVYVVWQDGTPKPWEILLKISNDYGASFGKAINLSHNDGFSAVPQIAVASDNNYADDRSNARDVYVVWYDDYLDDNSQDGLENFEVILRVSHDSGVTFSDPVNISNTPNASYSPQIAVNGSKVYLMWQDFSYGNGDILLRVSDDRGATFGPTMNLSGDRKASSNFQMTISGNNYLYVAWLSNDVPETEFASVQREIISRASTDGGKSFGYKMLLSSNLPESFDPQIASSGNNVYVVWRALIPYQASDIMFRSSNDAGTTFGRIYNLSHDPSNSLYPLITAENNSIYIMWPEDGWNTLSLIESHDGGGTFTKVAELQS